jgi:hypothetical protein
MQVCYDGELFHRVLALANATPEERAQAVLGLPKRFDVARGPLREAGFLCLQSVRK